MDDLLTRTLTRRATLAEIIRLRHAILRPGLPLETAHFQGDDEPATLHFGVFHLDTGENLSCASFMLNVWDNRPAYQLRGMSTRADLSGRGLGRALLQFAERAIAREGRTFTLWGNARMAAMPFYLKLGWSVVSEAFEIPGVGMHHKILKHLTEGVST